MNKNLKHLAALSLLAHAGEKLHPAEVTFLKSVAKRFDIDEKTAAEIIDQPEKFNHSLPVQEIDRYLFLGDILNLIAADGDIDENEIEQCRQLCSKFGFEQRMVDGILGKVTSHIHNGFDSNKISEAIQEDLNRLTSKITKNDRHN